MQIFPSRLERGDKIGIIAPSGSIGNLSEDIIQRGYNYLIDKGFKIVESNQCRIITGHTAGSVVDRVNAIHGFFRDESIKCIMAFWGGANSNQLLEYLDFELIRKNPKVFIGYSDFTALTVAITKKTDLITFSGPAVISFAKPDPFDYTWEYFDQLCVNPVERLKIEPSDTFADDLNFIRNSKSHRVISKNTGLKVYRSGRADGFILAGNLQTLLILCGTEYSPDFKDVIVFLEEDESTNTAMVHRFLTQLRQIGALKQIRGMIFGRFMSQTGFNDEDRFEDVLDDVLKEYTFPIMYNADFGHTDPLFTIPNGGSCTIDASKKEIIINKAVI